MNNVQLTQHLVLLEERAAELEAHMAAIEPLLRRIESALPVPSALSLVAQRLGAIDSKLGQLVPPEDVRKLIEDAFATYGMVVQLREVYITQRDDLAILVGLAGKLLEEERKHDATGVDEREQIHQLLVQLLELGRKHVAGLYDLERAVGWRPGDAERRKAG